MSVFDRLTTALEGRYRVERELGAGGMATVYLAHDLRHERDVAIKVLHPDLGAALGAERFLSEIKVTAKLQHPHILPLLDSGAADGLLYYVMPFVRGETLRARLERETQLPIADAVRIAREVAGALDHAHKQGIIHRDIKPENILLQDGSALVADFGIALAVQSAGTQRLTQTGLSLGTPQYMSPEQAMGERVIDARSDLYALGAVTYEMLTGEPPFSGASVQAIVAKVMNAEPERPTLLRKTIPSGVEAAVLTAIAKLPADRFASASEFAVALTNPQGNAPSSADAAPPRTAAPSRSRGHVVATVLGTAMLAAVGGWMLRGAQGAGTTPKADNVLTRVQVTSTGVAGLPALSPAGDVLAYVDRRCAQRGYDGFQGANFFGVRATPCRDNLLVQDTGASEAVRVWRDVRDIRAVRFTASATSLVIAATLDSLSAGVFVIPRLGGTPRRIAPMGFVDTHAEADSAIVLEGTREFGSAAFARIVDVGSAQVVDSVGMPSRFITGIAWSPNGRWIAATVGTKLFLVDRRTGHADSANFSSRDFLRWTPDGTALVYFEPAPGRDDDLRRVRVTSSGTFEGSPASIAPRSQTLYRGEFDLARRSGLMALVTGSSTTDLYTFLLTPGLSPVGRAVTSGTAWYAAPSIAPDGRALYYLRGSGNGDNVYRVATDTIDAEEQAVSTGGGGGARYAIVDHDGKRVLFQRTEGNRVLTYDIDLDARTNRAIDVGDGATWRPGLVPFGRTGAFGVSRDMRALQSVDAATGRTTSVTVPDSLKAYGFALSPDASTVVVQLASATNTIWGVTPRDRWALRVLHRASGPPIFTTLSWRDDGFVYFTGWDASRRAPILRRLNAKSAAETMPETVMALPERCVLTQVVVAASAPVGACPVMDFRGDVYLWRLEGLVR